MPSGNSVKLRFNNLQARHFAPIVLYFDLESILVPVVSASNNPLLSRSDDVEKHIPSGYCLVAIEQHTQQEKMFKLEWSENCISDFLKVLEKVARDMHFKKQQNRFFKGNVDTTLNSDDCWLCGEQFGVSTEISNDKSKVLDHCHYTGEFLGWAHSRCNLKKRALDFTTVVAQNLSNYDLHHLCLQLHECNPSNQIRGIPTTDEKYISLCLRVHITDYINESGWKVGVYEEMRFIDSFRFMGVSLEKLVSLLPDDAFKIVRQYFAQKFSDNQTKLLEQKGFYP